jgi:hypothetical protein
MPSSLISLSDSERVFSVQYGDYVTIVPGVLRNADRLCDSVLVTAGAAMAEAVEIDDPFSAGALYADEVVWYYKRRLPVNAANCAALLASGFRWTNEAADAATEFRISAAAVEAIRRAGEKHHRESEELLMGRRGADAKATAALWTQHEDGARGQVGWQITDSTEYIIPSESIVVSPSLGVRKRRQWWQFWKPS